MSRTRSPSYLRDRRNASSTRGPVLRLVVPTTWAAWLLVSSPLAPSLASQSLRDPTFMTQAEAGFAHIRNLDYDEAEQIFSRLQEQHPDHPAPLLYRAVVIWLRELFEREEIDLDRFASPGYFTRPAERTMRPERRKAFETFIRECQERSQAILDRNPGHADARYFLGASYGVLAAFTFTIDRSYLRALKYGKEAHRYQRALVEEHPQYYDAYMSVGVYEYVAASLPWYVKWLAALGGHRGSKERAFRYLSLAAERGEYVADDARVLLMVLFVRERRHDEALHIAQRLHQEFPRNYIFHLNQAQILEGTGRKEQVAQIYREVVELAEAGQRNYNKIQLAKFRYIIGKKLMELGDLQVALREFERSVEDARTPDRERALSHLGAGQILDVWGHRDAATAHYREVLRLQDVDGSHSHARRFAMRPYRQKRD